VLLAMIIAIAVAGVSANTRPLRGGAGGRSRGARRAAASDIRTGADFTRQLAALAAVRTGAVAADKVHAEPAATIGAEGTLIPVSRFVPAMGSDCITRDGSGAVVWAPAFI